MARRLPFPLHRLRQVPHTLPHLQPRSIPPITNHYCLLSINPIPHITPNLFHFVGFAIIIADVDRGYDGDARARVGLAEGVGGGVVAPEVFGEELGLALVAFAVDFVGGAEADCAVCSGVWS